MGSWQLYWLRGSGLGLGFIGCRGLCPKHSVPGVGGRGGVVDSDVPTFLLLLWFPFLPFRRDASASQVELMRLRGALIFADFEPSTESLEL